MIVRLMAVGFLAAGLVPAQNTKPATPAAVAPDNGALTTKIFELKYLDPEQIRGVFASQSYVMEANRELKLLTVRGSSALLKQVDEIIKRLDVPAPIPPNAQITVYLLAAAAQAPAGIAPPAELKALSKDLPAKLADTHMFRVRTGQAGETSSDEPPAPPAVSLERVRVDSASVSSGAKGDVVSLNGLKIWLNIPPTDTTATPAKAPRNQPDVAEDIDVNPDEAVIVAKIGVDKPLAVVIRVNVIR